MVLPRPRAYVDWTAPADDKGNPIGVCRDPELYSFYLDWLADYLHSTDIPVPECQRELLEEYRAKGVDRAVLDLSDDLGYSLWETDSLERASAEDVPYSHIQKIEREAWEDVPEKDKAEWTEEDYFTSLEDYERIGREFRESKRVPGNITHADIPYRPLLAALFKGIPDHSKRRELLDFFYRNFNECASK